jgi:hypothetical protein
LTTISPDSYLIKLDLKSGFFQIHIRPEYYQYYGLYYRRRRLAWTRLLMGHPLAPSIMQRVATGVARTVTDKFDLTMVAYLDDWLFFSQHPIPVQQLLQHLQQMGFTNNQEKSILQPTTALVYLGLNIDTHAGLITPTRSCIQHLLDLVSIVPRATTQDLQRITGYVAWLASAMSWPAFLATLIAHRVVYWITRLHRLNLLQYPRTMRPPLRSIALYKDATPTSVAAVIPGPPRAIVQHYTDTRTIAFTEMAAALRGLLWYIRDVLTEPTTITLYTDSSTVYYTLVKGTGLTLRASPLLQQLFVATWMNKNKAGHGLVVRWVPSEHNLADPLTRGVHPPLKQSA